MDPSHSDVNEDVHFTHGSPLTSDELNRWKNFTIDNGYLLHKGRVCVPSDLDTRRQILYECHDSPSASHPSIRKTYEGKYLDHEYIYLYVSLSLGQVL